MRYFIFAFFLLSAPRVLAQERSVWFDSYYIRDIALRAYLVDTLSSKPLIDLKKRGYKPVLYIKSISDCFLEYDQDTITRPCVSYELYLEKVTPGITGIMTKVAVAQLNDGELLFLVIYNYTGLLTNPYQVEVPLVPLSSKKFGEYLRPIKIFTLIRNNEGLIKQ